MPEAGLLAEAVRIGRSLTAPAGEPEILSARRDVLVVRVGDVVVKVHPERTDPVTLATRLRVAADPRLADILVPPIEPSARTVAGRQVTLWPAGRTVSPDAEDAPWEAGATLLARLHAVPAAGFAGPLPPCMPPSRLNRAVRRLGDDPSGKVIRQAHATLPGWIRQERAVASGTGPDTGTGAGTLALALAPATTPAGTPVTLPPPIWIRRPSRWPSRCSCTVTGISASWCAHRARTGG